MLVDKNNNQTGALVVYVNGRKHVERDVDPRQTLLQYLRDPLQLRGTKEACGVGGCGACSVMLSRYDRQRRKIRHWAVTACLVPLCAVHDCAVTTVEGVGTTRTKVHLIQERLARGHGTQCGFCSPGVVMSMYALLRNNPEPTFAEIQRALEGNLCRCTGYRPILESLGSFAKDCPMGENCCRKSTQLTEDCPTAKEQGYDPSQEPLFPPELQLSDTLEKGACFTKGDVTWYAPCNVKQVLALMKELPQAVLLAGNTALQEKFQGAKEVIYLGSVSELQFVRQSDAGLEIGAGTTIAQLEEELAILAEKEKGVRKQLCDVLLKVAKGYAASQIRNLATVGGSVSAGVPWSDITPIFLLLGAALSVRTPDGKLETIPLSSLLEDSRAKGKLLLSFTIPFPEEIASNEKSSSDFMLWWNKTARRQCFDTAVVNMAATAELQDGVVIHATVAVGGLDAKPVLLSHTSTLILGRGTTSLVEEEPELSDTLSKDLPSSTADYQGHLVAGLFSKFLQHLASYTKHAQEKELPTGGYSSTRVFDPVPANQPETDTVGRPVAHLAAVEHTTGEAQYVSDMPEYTGGYHLSLVSSSRAHARLLEVDPSEALMVPGVIDFISHKDISNSSQMDVDEPYFAVDKVECVGQTIGAIVATDKRTATIAASMVKVVYEDLEPAILTIEDAIAKESFLSASSTFKPHHYKGSAETAMEAADHVIEGVVALGGQDHFYMETQGALVVPRAEKHELEVYCGTQSMYTIQCKVAEALGIPVNRVVVISKRMGGAFGGKESRPLMVAVPCAVAATKLQRPVRCMLCRSEDMAITGGRHPVMAKYKVGFNKDGALVSAQHKIYTNCGFSQDTRHSLKVTMVLCQASGGPYNIPNIRVDGFCCKTNLPSNTACRGYGHPEGAFIAETVIDHVANFLGKPREEIQRRNLLKEGDEIVKGQTLDDNANNLQRCWEECAEKADFFSRKIAVQQFNKKLKDKKRGIAMTPIRHGVCYWTSDYGQATAVLQVYAEDGSILLHIGGAEMGQGLYTKVVQVASRVLGIPGSLVHVYGSRTDAVPNSATTGNSIGSELHGEAVKDACEKMLERLAPYRVAAPVAGWQDWVKAAYANQESLVTTGSAKKDHRPYLYHTYGAACSEVEVDCLTGAHKVLRTDIVMDIGTSLNPAIDIGQIEGGFLMGYGLFMLEDVQFNDRGKMTTAGPEHYKIPAIKDIPLQFNVHFLKDAGHQQALYSSKAIGEPPLILSLSAFMALKNAVTAAREEKERGGYFRLDAPATPPRVLRAMVQ